MTAGAESKRQTTVVSLEAVHTLVEGLDHPEGVAYGPDGNVYAGGEAGQVYRVSLSGQVEQIAGTGGFVLGLALDAQRNVYVCDLGRKQVLRIDGSGSPAVRQHSGGWAAAAAAAAVHTLCAGTPDGPLRTPNYPVFDRLGRLYVSDSGEWQRNDGSIVRIDPDGAAHLVSHAAPHFPNGLALSADQRWLYVAESTLPGVTRLPVAADGGLGDAEVVVRLPGDVPDGLAFDVSGALYISCYRPDRIYRLSAGGDLEIFADDPAGTALAAPTNLAFAGPRLDRLVIASLGRWHLAVVDVDVPGQPLIYPDLASAVVDQDTRLATT